MKIRTMTRLQSLIVVALALFAAPEFAQAQQLVVHNLTHSDATAFEGDLEAQGKQIGSGETATFDTFSGVPWHFKTDLGIVSTRLVRDVDQDVFYVTSHDVFGINDIVVIKTHVDGDCLSPRTGLKLDNPGAWWYVREGKRGDDIAFESVTDSQARLFMNSSFKLSPHPFHQDYLTLYTADGKSKLIANQNRPELAPAGAAWPSRFVIKREIEAWLAKDQPPRNLKGQGLLTEKSLTDGFTGQLVAVDHHCRSGYNLLKMNPFNLQHRGTNAGGAGVIAEYHPDAGKTYYIRNNFRIPKNLFFTDENKARSEVTETMYRSRSELSKGFSVSVSLGAGNGKDGSAGKSIGAKGGYESKHSKMDQNERFLKVGTKWSSHMWLTLDKEMIRLDPKLVTFVAKMDPNQYVGSSLRPGFKQLFEQFGTHYPLSTLFGARAVLEEEVTMETVAKSAMESISGGLQGSAKGVSAGVEVGFSEESKSETSSSNKSHVFHRSGGTGSSFESFGIGEAKNWAPIKVDLHPLCELIRPEFVAEECSPELSRKLTEIRIAGRGMLKKYLDEETEKNNFYLPEPCIIEAQFDHVKCTKSDDAGGQPDLYGSMGMGFYDGKDKNISFDTFWTIPDDGDADEDGMISKTDANQGKKGKMLLSILPKRGNGGDWPEKFFQVHFNLKDWDPGANPDEQIQGDCELISLDTVIRLGTHTVKFTKEEPDFGKMEFQFTLRRVNYHLKSDEDTLPDIPRFTSR